MPLDDGFIVGPAAIDSLIRELAEGGWEPWGPVVRDGAVVPGPVTSMADLPVGWHDRQEAGEYALRDSGDDEVFGWAVGPGSWKAVFFPPAQTVWEGSSRDGEVTIANDVPKQPRPLALVGARPCEVAALGILDAVLAGGPVPDPGYRKRRQDAFVVVAECSTPAGTCFCSSMGTGPSADRSYDIAVTELGAGTGDGHRFLLRAGTERGAELIRAVGGRAAGAEDLAERAALLERASAGERRRLDATAVPGLLARNIDHPHWQDVAERCLACGNCTMVCPTCFCSDVRDVTDLRGGLSRRRVWASCFDIDHSYLHGGAVRRSRASRYRQWITHKLSTWHDQFGSSGCVGCGRCIAWCPAAIDITAEVEALARAERDGEAGGKEARR